MLYVNDSPFGISPWVKTSVVHDANGHSMVCCDHCKWIGRRRDLDVPGLESDIYVAAMKACPECGSVNPRYLEPGDVAGPFLLPRESS